jgi:pimeloyl-ACP methyl ester carboxylesterase
MSEHALAVPTYARTVRGAGPGLLLAHGANGDIERHYGPILDGLAAHRTVVGVDYPGAGGTPRSAEPLTADQLADQLVAAADAEGLGTFAIAGFSLGGPVAIRAAARYPERVTALVLTATFARADARLRLTTSVWRKLYESGDHTLLAEFLTLMAFSTQALNSWSHEQLQAVIQRISAGLPPGTPEHADLVSCVDVLDDLPTITMPTLVIVTTGDLFVPPGLQRSLAGRLPNAQIAEVDSAHARERPEEWLDLITKFLST